MEEPDAREPEELEQVTVTLDAETLAHYETRAQASGRTVEAQIRYELEVNHGLCPPDPGDVEATQRGQIFRRIFAKTPLNG
jgi:hypothetical protein